MLSDRDLELIHAAVDGTLDAAQRDALVELLASSEEAAALSADLHRLHEVFARVPAAEPSPALRAALVAAIPPRPRALPAAPVVVPRSLLTPRPVSLFTLAVRRMEEVLMSRKLFLIGATSVAIIAVIAGRIFPIPSTGNEVGTVGGSEIGGVQKADRYRGRSMSEKDVTVANPEIAVLFQNQDILTLVKSGAFREAMKSDAFRELQANAAFREMASSESFRELMKSEAYAMLAQNDAFLKVMANDAARDQLFRAAERMAPRAAERQVDAKQLDREAAQVEAFRELEKQEAFRELSKLDAFREAAKLDAFRAVMANDAFREMMAKQAFRAALANDAFRAVMANDAFRALQSSEAFRNVARDAALSELFLNEASRMRAP